MKESEKNIQEDNKKFNWKIVIIATIIIGIVYAGLAIIIDKRKTASLYELETTYCYFKKDIIDNPLPRTECGYLKIYSNKISEWSIDEIKKLNVSAECSDSVDNLPKCEGEEYHFTQSPLEVSCYDYPCNEGYVCGAYFMTYYGNHSLKALYIENTFIEPYIMSEEMLMTKLLDCNSGYADTKNLAQEE